MGGMYHRGRKGRGDSLITGTAEMDVAEEYATGGHRSLAVARTGLRSGRGRGFPIVPCRAIGETLG